MSRLLHGLAALAHGTQSTYGFVLTNQVYPEKGKVFLSNPVARFEKQEEAPTPFAEYRLGNLVSAFPALSTINHLWSVLDKPGYDKVLKQGYNPVRWGEYSVSAGIMFWTISQLTGIRDVKILFPLLLGNAALQYTGYSIEKDVGQKRFESANRQQVSGFVLFLALWIPLFVAFFTAIERSANKVPPEVYAIIFVLFSLMLCFGILSLLYSTQRITDFRKIETGYLVLSFVSKTLLTNLTLFGVLFSEPDEPAATPSA